MKQKSSKSIRRKWYILANGEGTRWGNYRGVPKQLIEIDGETILHRMIRLLRKEGVKKSEIFICGKLTDAEANTILTTSKTKREVFEEIAELAKAPFGILYGDCYYTESIIHELVNRPVKKYDEFFTIHGNPNTGCRWAEGYAHRCDDWKWWRDEMHGINTNAELIKTGKDWFIHWWLLGVRDERINQYPVECFNPDHDIPWLDQTDDFDYPSDLDTFCQITGHKCTNKERPDKLTVILTLYNANNWGWKIMNQLSEQKKQFYPETELIAIDDGSTDDTSYMNVDGWKVIHQENKGASGARNTGLNLATGRYISFVDADDLVTADYLHQIYTIMRKEKGEYAIYPFIAMVNGSTAYPRKQLIGNYAVWAYSFTYNCIGKERFDENLNVAEDVDWLRRVVTEDKKRYEAPNPLYMYDWNANSNSLSKRFNRGDIKKTKKEENE